VLNINEEEKIHVLGARKKSNKANNWSFGQTEGEEMKEHRKEERE